MDFSPLIGILLSILAGLYPILHPNTVVNWIDLPVEVIMGLYIPLSILASMFLSYNSEDLSFLPAFRLNHAGYGWGVIAVWVSSILFGAVLGVLVIPYVEGMFYTIYPIAPYIIAIISVILLVRLGLLGVGVFLLCGALGLWALNGGLYEPLLVLFSGFFAFPSLLGETKTVKVKEKPFHLSSIIILPISVVFALLFITLPGVSSASTSIALLSVAVPLDSWAYLAVNGGFISSQTIIAFYAKENLGIVRIGAVRKQNTFDLELFLTSLISGSLLTLALYPYAKRLYIKPIKYLLAAIIATYVLEIEGLVGLAALIISSTIGIFYRLKGGQAFPFFGSIIIPTMVRMIW